MNARERFLTIMQFEKPDRALLWEFGYWEETIRRWYHEGLPCRMGILENRAMDNTIFGEGLPYALGDPVDRDIHEFLELDSGIIPPFEEGTS